MIMCLLQCEECVEHYGLRHGYVVSGVASKRQQWQLHMRCQHIGSCNGGCARPQW